MPYLVQSTIPYALTVDGKDVTDRLISFAVSDTSPMQNGVVQTSGTLTLGTVWDEDPESAYGTGEFKRGSAIVLTMMYPDGSTGLHPRGTLRVLASTYSPQEEATLIDIGCELTYRRLVDDFSGLIGEYAPTELEPARRNFEGLSSALAAYNSYIYTDKQGSIQKEEAWGATGTLAGFANFTSVRGVTALNVSPLGGGEPIPDKIEISYSYPLKDPDEEDDPPYRTTDTTESFYFLTYPGLVFIRLRKDDDEIPIAEEIEIEEFEEGIVEIPESTPCGPPPPAPPDAPIVEGEDDSDLDGFGDVVPYICSDFYRTKKTQAVIPVSNFTENISEYYAPAGQQSYSVSRNYGPKLEINPAFFADKYDYCRRVYGHPCNGGGGCELYGLTAREMRVLQSYSETFYYYGKANELIRSVTDTYATKLSAASSNDWRAGTTDGLSGTNQSFDFDFDSKYMGMFLAQRVIAENDPSPNPNIKQTTTTTYTSSVSKTKGILTYSGASTSRNRVERNIDAMSGVVTAQVQRSTTTQILAVNTDRLNPDTIDTVDDTTIISLSSLEELVSKESTPSLYNETSSDAKQKAQAYGESLKRFIIGNAKGLNIAESLRFDIVSSWTPSGCFYYYDDKHDKTVLLKMDSCSWAVDSTGSAVVVNGLYVAPVGGTYREGDNLEGDITPDMTGDNPTVPPVNPEPEPDIEDPDVIEPYILDIDVDLTLAIDVVIPNGSGIIVAPGEYDGEIIVDQTLAFSVRGMLAQPGALVANGPSGSLPIDFNGTLVVDNLLVIDSDLFS